MKRPLAKSITAIAAVALAGCAALRPAQEAGGWKPKDPPMLTRWAKDVDPRMPMPEYPRPQLTRKNWQNLNGLWNYAVVKKGSDQPATWDGRILVPYPIESALSGVKRPFQPDEVLYYQRSFKVPAGWEGKRVILHFGAVDYRAEISVNGKRVGSHEGGYDPFSLDITEQLEGDGEQTLTVRVTDPTWTEGIPRGKQTLSPAGIMYTPTSGIWQTVWLEPVAEGGIERLHIVPDVKGGTVKVTVDLYGHAKGEVSVKVAGAQAVTGQAGSAVTVPMNNPELWTPDHPHLYNMTVQAIQDGRPVDEVGSYFGMRSVEMAFLDGHQRVLLNGEPVFMFGPLDQGFWPDGCYSAPTDAALKSDLEVIKQLGFNTVRKHIKVEPARWYYHADRLGLLVWQDMPSANSYDTPPGGRPAVDAPAFETQLKAMIKNLENHPSIVMWIIFNESQGKHDTIHLVKLAQELDSSRLVNEDSGHQDFGGRYEGVGDLFDEHPYPPPRAYESPKSRAFVLGEYGGIGLKAGDNNPWQSKGWGYTTTANAEELENLYAKFAGMIHQFKEKNGLVGAIYTQITDVEIEINGLMTYDRHLKVNPKWIAKANRFEWSGPTFDSLIPTSQNASPVYQYTFRTPGADWMKPDGDTSRWQQGPGGFGTKDTPGIGRIGTTWDSPDIWLRRTINLPALSKQQLDHLVLNLHHDDDVQVYINGVLAYEKVGWESGYVQVALSESARKALKPGAANLVAVHCHQTGGGQYIDVGLGTLNRQR